MKTECSVPQKVVFECWLLSSSLLGICVTYKSATPTSSCLRNIPVKKLSCFWGFWVVSSGWISRSWASSSEKWLFFLHWENKLWIWVGWGWRIHLPVSLLTSRWGPFFGVAQLKLVAHSWLGLVVKPGRKHRVEEVGVLLGFFLLAMRTVTCTSERTVLDQLSQLLLLSTDGLITFLSARLVLGSAALWFILEGKTSLELLCSLKLWGLIHFTWSTDKLMVTTINHVFWEL